MLILVFPGQGSQAIGMARSVVDRFPVARAIFDSADKALGFPLSKLCFEGPEAELQLTANSQPAILTASVAILRALQENTSLVPQGFAGHSLGEYTALVAAGALQFEDAVRAVRKRGELMQSAVPAGKGSMAALGCDAARADTLCQEAAQGAVLSAANYNSPSQVVVAGDKAAIDRLLALTEKQGVAAKELKVSAPFHCALMQPAADRMRAELEKLRFQTPSAPVLSNVDAMPYGNDAVDRLVRQITLPVRWEQIVRRLGEMGMTQMLEVGPGKVLTNLTRRMSPTVKATSCENAADVDAAAQSWPPKASPVATREQKAAPALKPWEEMTADERTKAISELILFDKVLADLDAKPHDIYRWMSVNRMPTWLVEGELRFHPVQLAEWLQQIGGIAALKAKEAAQLAADKAEDKEKKQATH